MYRWLLPVGPEIQIELVEQLNSPQSFSPVFSHWVDLFRPHLHKYGLLTREGWPADMLASALVFFYGCTLCLACLVPDVSPYIDSLVDYTLLYMLTDNYLDSQVLTPQALDEMSRAVLDPTFEPSDKYVQDIREVYLRLCERHPQARSHLIHLFQSEVAGLKVQRKANLSHQEYLQAAETKGAATFLFLSSICNVSDTQVGDLGSIMQLLDDMLDVEVDRDSGCHTVATHWLQTHGSLDGLWDLTLTRIEKLSPPFNIWGCLYSLLLVYIPQRTSRCFSSSLISQTNGYNPMALCNGSGILVSRLICALTCEK